MHVVVDNLLLDQIYLGSTGKRMQGASGSNLLENLRGHGVVSEVDAQDRFTIRPMIVHLASGKPATLLQRPREISGNSDSNSTTPGEAWPGYRHKVALVQLGALQAAAGHIDGQHRRVSPTGSGRPR